METFQKSTQDIYFDIGSCQGVALFSCALYFTWGSVLEAFPFLGLSGPIPSQVTISHHGALPLMDPSYLCSGKKDP